MKKRTTSQVIKMCVDKHGDTYDYSEFEYVSPTTPSKIICKFHGGFFQSPSHHYNRGDGCPKCRYKNSSISQRSTKDEVVVAFRKVHGDRYGYGNITYKGDGVNVSILCHVHGTFSQSPSNHKRGQGCPKCKFERLSHSKVTMVNKFKSTHGDTYDYSQSDYIGTKDKITIRCKNHGYFKQRPNNHEQGQGCPKCASTSGVSKFEQDVLHELEQVNINDLEILTSDRTLIAPYELDIYIPAIKVAIECNGHYWHNLDKKPKNYHRDKFIACRKKGIRLIQIWDFKWVNDWSKYVKLFRHLFKSETVSAEECEVVDVDRETAISFFKANHLEGCGVMLHTNVNKGLTYNNKLLMVTSFNDKYIHRVCTLDGYRVYKGLSKLINLAPKGCVMFMTNDTGSTLFRLKGWKREKYNATRYWWVRQIRDWGTREKFQKHKLLKKHGNHLKNMTETSICEGLGYHKCEDSGLTKLRKMI